jgi:hypothetical protein
MRDLDEPLEPYVDIEHDPSDGKLCGSFRCWLVTLGMLLAALLVGAGALYFLVQQGDLRSLKPDKHCAVLDEHQPDDPHSCIGKDCCRCSNDSPTYNPTPPIMENFNVPFGSHFDFKLHVVQGAPAGASFPVNTRLISVTAPTHTPPPPGGWPVVLFLNGAESHLPNGALTDPYKACVPNGCGLNITQPMVRILDSLSFRHPVQAAASSTC